MKNSFGHPVASGELKQLASLSVSTVLLSAYLKFLVKNDNG